jgi:hypothetical protein
MTGDLFIPSILQMQFRSHLYCMQSYSSDGIKHPVRSDFQTVVTEAGVSVTFTPTNSVYSFSRRADAKYVGRLGYLSFAGVLHAGHNTDGYAPDKVQDMAQQIASEFARSVCFQERSPLADITMPVRPASLASVPRRIASEVAATLRLIQNLDAD